MVALDPKDPVAIEETQSDIDDRETDGQSNYEILVYPTDFTLQVLYEKWKAKSLKLPEFQRQYVWNRNKASRLIESFLLGLPVPGIFLYLERDTGHQLVIDGQQRLLSTFFYFKGKFANNREFRLSNKIHRRWQGRAYKDLEEPDQIKLSDSVLRATIVRQLHPHDDTSIFHIFERLNTTATPLSAQEIRNCLYHGTLNDALKNMNRENEAWRAIMGSPNVSTRQRDVELALRMISLWLKESEYKEPMKDFLNTVMGDHRDLPLERLREWRDLFEQTSALIVGRLGERPFHIRAGLNAAVFDSVSVAFARNLDRVPEDIMDRYERLKSDPDFIKSTTSSTTSVYNVRQRIAVAERILFGSGAGCE